MTDFERAVSVAEPHFNRLINEFGRSCFLIFQDGKTECPNCILDIDTQRSANIYKTGGAESFASGDLCPVCLGEGFIGSHHTRSIKMNVVANPKKWMSKVPPNVNLSQHAIMGTFFVEELPYVLKARHIVILVDLQGYIKYEYFLKGEPFDSNHIVQGKYISAFWDRTSGA